MTAPRTQLRQDVIDTLVAAGIVAAGHVYDSRTTPIADNASAYPAIIVRTPSTRDTEKGPQSLDYNREVTLVVDCYNLGATDAAVAAQLDELEEAVKAALCGSAEFLRAYGRVRVVDCSTDIKVESAGRYGLARLAFTIPRLVRYDVAGLDTLASIVLRVRPIAPPTGAPVEDPIATVEVTL